MMLKKNISRLLVVVMVFSLMAVVTSCGKVKEKIGEKIAEEATEKLLGENVEINNDGFEIKGEDGESFQVGEELDWPEDSMGDIPEFKGSIISSYSDDQTCTVILEDVDSDDVEDYIDELKDMDFEDGLEANNDEMIMYSGTREDEADTITVTFSKTEKGITIIYNKEQP